MQVIISLQSVMDLNPLPRDYQHIWGHAKPIVTAACASRTAVKTSVGPRKGFSVYYAISRYGIDYLMLNKWREEDGEERLLQLINAKDLTKQDWVRQTHNVNADKNLNLSLSQVLAVAEVMDQLTSPIWTMQMHLNEPPLLSGGVSMMKGLLSTNFKFPLKVFCHLDYLNDGYTWFNDMREEVGYRSYPLMAVVGPHKLSIYLCVCRIV